MKVCIAEKPSVAREIATILGDKDISIETMAQKPLKCNNANLLLSTHICKEVNIKNALLELESTGIVLETPVMIRIDS